MSEIKTTTSEKKQKPNLKYLRDKDREMVRGKFIYHEVPGGTLRFVTKFYKEDPVESWSLVDGEVYHLPLGVARHINKNMWYPEYEFIPGADKLIGARNPFGTKNPMLRVAKKVRRATFHSMDFVDIDDITPVGQAVVSEVVTANR